MELAERCEQNGFRGLCDSGWVDATVPVFSSGSPAIPGGKQKIPQNLGVAKAVQFM
jgi:hypothetical protein